MMHFTLTRRRRPLALAIALAFASGGTQAATITVTDGSDSGDSGTCTLRQAIAVIAASDVAGTSCSNSGDVFGSNDTIVFDTSAVPSNSTIYLSGTLGELSVSNLAHPLTIQGSGQTIDAGHNSPVVHASTATLMLSSVTLTNGSASDDIGSSGSRALAGGIYATYSNVSLDHVTVSNNTAALSYKTATQCLTNNMAGGIYASHSTLALTNVTVSNNTAALCDKSATLCTNVCTVRAIAGGINLDNYSNIAGNHLTVSHNSAALCDNTSTLCSNSQTVAAGGVFAGSPMTLSQSTVSSNTLSVSNTLGNDAGGIFATGAPLTLIQSTVSGNNLGVYNTNGDDGGGILFAGAALTLNQSTVSDNVLTPTYQSNAQHRFPATGAAGITIHKALGNNVSIVDSTISGNTVTSDIAYLAGGIFSYRSYSVNITNSTLAGNSISCYASCGAALFNADLVTVVLTNSTVSANLATVSGAPYGSPGTGGAAAYYGSLTLNNTILSGNSNNGSNSDLDIYSGTVTASSSLLGFALSGNGYGSNNVYNDDPGLSGLNSNGGPTQTMALILSPLSPAANVGDPALAKDPSTSNALLFDQRGPGYQRMLPDGTVDIGAYQHQGTDRVFADPFESGP